ncbi:cytochrome d ubiquinol oxidase subunit II [Corynebacterium pacaense]|uniref:cytochrome d ubiquinol oxidase subunit II n=1 Tax=Corynebacterium pacaense TaxID=1816684 RepID=UPI0009BAEC13|nr:cytochrome d ubiquinol oxidase subunit II [Corynebacterium pacaense]
MDLNTIWFILVAILFAGYFLLEGFDFGVGILAPLIGRNRAEKNAIIKTIGPVWDGNEVWLITAAGAMFAAFPEWYATLFSGMYLPLFLLLVALIVRVVGLEWRKKVDDPRWLAWSDRAIIVGSWTPALLWGLIFSNVLRGMPVRADHSIDAAAALGGLFNPYALLGAVAFTALFALHGLVFIRLKTAGEVRAHAGRALLPVVTLSVLSGVPYVIWTAVSFGESWSWVLVGVVIIGVIAGGALLRFDHDGLSFAATSVAVLATVALIFTALFPEVMPTTLVDGTSLDIWNASSSPYTLRILTWVAAFMTPAVIAYQGWTYWVFRRRITAEPTVPTGDTGPAGAPA